MLNLIEFALNPNLTAVETIKDRVSTDLSRIKFNLFGTVQLNLSSINTSLIENSFKLVKEFKQSIQNDFSGRYKYFIRPALSGTFHYHFLLKIRRPMKFKRSKQGKYSFETIVTNEHLEEYSRHKNEVFELLKQKYSFPAAQFDLQRPITSPDIERCVDYVVYNTHQSQAFEKVDLKKYFTGDAAFCYHTNIWRKQQRPSHFSKS